MHLGLSHRFWLGFAGVASAAAVAADAMARHAAAFDAHAIDLLRTAARYQGWHALALIAVVLLAGRDPAGAVSRAALTVAGWAFVLGSVLFCGGLAVLVAGGPPAVGAVVPFGGGTFILGWLALAVAGTAWRG